MKKRLLSAALALLLLLPSVGCEKADPKTGSGQAKAGNAAETNPSDVGIDPEWPRPDYSGFTLPGETGELLLYADMMSGDVITPAVRIFESLYPGVTVTVERYGEDEIKERIRADLPAGKGPDLLVFGETTIPDVYKTESTGLFADLGGYFEADPEIDRADFVPGVMNGMLFRGLQYVVPLHYEVPILVTTEALLRETGVEDPSAFEDFAEAARRYKEAHPDGTLFVDVVDADPTSVNLKAIARYAGIPFIDYPHEEVSCDEERFRTYIDLLKLYDVPDYDVGNYTGQEYKMWGDYLTHTALIRKECLFSNYNKGFLGFFTSHKKLRGEDAAVTFVPRDPDGSVMAEIVLMASIPEASKNKLNAWRLLKILLSDEIQAGRDESDHNQSYFWVGLPVRESSIRKEAEYNVEHWGYDLEDEEDRAIFQHYVDLCTSVDGVRVLPNVWFRYIRLEMFPYVYGEKPWDDCYKQFMNTLELYASE